MDRIQVINELMQQKGLRNYIEIGVFNGNVFFKIKSGFKVAVDPDFRFDWLRKCGKAIVNPYNLMNHYFEKTSDDFFANDASTLLLNRKIDIALIDGMHEYAYALRDVENVLKYLNDDGIILLHDCNPMTPDAAISAAEWRLNGSKGVWNGDVWKTILNIRSLRSDLTAFVLDCDHGLGIVVKRPSVTLPFSFENIDDFTFEDFRANRNHWLNLQRPEYLFEFFGLTK
ncbi:MAG: class I SAM-dependent methyltransferase [Cyclobacteriaceae bacterium]